LTGQLSIHFLLESSQDFGEFPNNVMISNERSSSFHRQSYRQPYHQPFSSQQPPRPFVQEDTLKSEQIQIERKSFHLTLKENPRGRFLRISEDVGGRRNAIIIPATGLKDFKRLLDEMAVSSNALPPKLAPSAQPASHP